MKAIDVHGHIQFPDFDADRAEIVKRARDVGVKMIAVGTQAATSKKAIEIAHQFSSDVWATVGFHPNHLSKNWHHDEKEQAESKQEVFDINVLRELAKDPKVVSISECGFDFFYDKSDAGLQEKAFGEQASLARELNKPLMMHCRPSKGTDDAYKIALEILSDPKFDNLKKIMHFYAGSLDMAKKLAKLGFYFTFGGVITFARSYDEIIKYLPLDRIFAETDCPYVAPQSHRGKRNEPAYVVEVVLKIAELKGLDFEEAADELYENSVKIFNLK
ncbi:MAG: TatD family hydrolase [Patescibacteria group bacterium]|nr:TatD family hydrolase [Patescibacteria group bacterium]